MRRTALFLLSLFLISCVAAEEKEMEEKIIALPKPKLKSEVSLEETILKRRSVRSFSSEELSLEQIGQILWAASGITATGGTYRAAPSAGATYPMEIYLVNRDGVYHYLPRGHKLELFLEGDKRSALARAALGQSSVAQAPANIVIAAIFERTTARYGERGIRYVHIEAGHIAQNIHLEAVALGLASVPVGAFSDDKVREILILPKKEEVLYIIPVGYAK